MAADDSYAIEISKVVAVVEHAAEDDEAIVNVIHPPGDWASARRVQMPLARAWKQESWFASAWREFLRAAGIGGWS